MKIPKGGNQNPYIEEERTTQWPKEKLQKEKQRSTNIVFDVIYLSFNITHPKDIMHLLGKKRRLYNILFVFFANKAFLFVI